MPINLFIVFAILFFLYVEVKLFKDGGLSRTEKVVSLICFLALEFYYVMSLLERLGQ